MNGSTPEPVSARGAALAGAAIFVLTCYSPLLSLHYEGLLGAFKYLAADAFYYLAVADRSAEAGFFTQDGIHPVNAFHPAWQRYLTFAFRSGAVGPDHQLIFSFGSSILFTAVGTTLFGLSVLRVTSSVSLALLASVPGIYHWVVPAAHPAYGAQWSFVNGMESPLSILLFGITLYLLLVRRWLEGEVRPFRILLFTNLLTLITLIRLDDVFLLVPFVAYLTFAEKSWRARIARAAWASLIPVVAIGTYLLLNFAYSGAAVPLSGVAKSGGPVGGLVRNAYALFVTVVPLADIRDVGLVVWGSESWRVLQMVVPALLALAWLIFRRPSRSRPVANGSEHDSLLLFLLAVYVLMKAAYNFCFVGLWHQGHWYYPTSLMTSNLLAAAFLAEAVRKLGLDQVRLELAPRGRGFALGPFFVAGWIVFIAVNAATYASLKARSDVHVSNFEFWSQRHAVEQVLEARCGGCGIVSFDDGIIAYSLSIPTMNGVGLMLDKEAFEAKRAGRLLALAYERGFRLIATLNYPFANDLTAANLRGALESYRHLSREPLELYDFAIVHHEPASGAVFIAFEPRSSASRDQEPDPR